MAFSWKVLTLLLGVSPSVLAGPLETISISPRKDGYTIAVGKTQAKLNQAEFDGLLQGKKIASVDQLISATCADLLTPQSDATIGVFSHHPQMEKSITEELAFTIADQYGFGHFVLSVDSPKQSETRITDLQEYLVRKPSNLAVVLPAKSFNVSDGKAMQNAGDVLKKQGVLVRTFSESARRLPLPAETRGVIVLSGHSNKNFEQYVTALAKTGSLKGKFVVFNTCQTTLSRDLAGRLIKDYGVRAVFRYQGIITSQQVSRIGEQLAKTMKEQSEFGEPGNKKFLPVFLMQLIQSIARDVGARGIWMARNESSTNHTRGNC